jgi:hypothetical protein
MPLHDYPNASLTLGTLKMKEQYAYWKLAQIVLGDIYA